MSPRKAAPSSEAADKPSPAPDAPVLVQSGWYQCPACHRRSTVAESIVHGPHPKVKA